MKLTLTAIFCISAFFATAQQQEHFTLLFDFNSVTISKQSRGTADSLLRLLKEHAVSNIVVNGHADKKGGDEFNSSLAYDRAMHVKEMIMAELPQNAAVQVNSYGEELLLSAAEDRQYLNRRVEITFTKKNSEVINEPEILEPYVADATGQQFRINLDETVRITAKGGTSVEIIPGSIQTKDGKIATGFADIVIKEYYSPGDIISAGINSVSPQGLLQSGGMFSLNVMQNGDTMATKTKKNVLIKMPVLDSSLKGMSVFTSAKHPDSSTWARSDKSFNLIAGYWALPFSSGRCYSVVYPISLFSTLAVGDTDTMEVRVKKGDAGRPYIFAGKGKLETVFFPKPDLRSYQMLIIKKDSSAISIALKFKYRSSGNRKYGSGNFDTTYDVKYMRCEYQGTASDFRWINCDQFYEYKNKTDFYVTTPGYQGMNVMAYFTSIRAFMPMIFDGKRYKLANVPADLPVVFVALGKKNDQLYFGKVKTFTKKGDKNELVMTKLSEDELKKNMKEL